MRRLKQSFNIIKRLKRVISEFSVGNSEHKTLPSLNPHGPFGRLSQIGLNSRPIFSGARSAIIKKCCGIIDSLLVLIGYICLQKCMNCDLIILLI